MSIRVRRSTKRGASSSVDHEAKRAKKNSSVVASAAAAAAATTTTNETASLALTSVDSSKTGGAFGSMAEKWIEKEMAWYCGDGVLELDQRVITAYGQGYFQGYQKGCNNTLTCKIKLEYGTIFCPQQNLHLCSNSEYHPVDNAGKGQISEEHLEEARIEYTSRFAFCTEEEDAKSHGFSGSPYLLVATNVKSTWTAPREFKFLRFMLVPVKGTCALFITCMPGATHGTVNGMFAAALGSYMEDHQLFDFVNQCHSGGETYQPDIRIYPAYPDLSGPTPDDDPDMDIRPFSRLVVEFEFGNRNASKLREVGHGVLNNDFATLFLGIKIWKKTRAGVFGAAAVLWEKDHTTGNIFVREAIDFGTKALSPALRNAWNNAAVNSLPHHLPPVVAADWTRPQPINAVAAAAAEGVGPVFRQEAVFVGGPAWILRLPQNLIFYRMPSSATPGSAYIPSFVPPLPDFEFDLKRYQNLIHRLLHI